jgi:hypothetical protein
MSIVHQKDKRSGITYVYESYNFWDKEEKKHKAKRTLLGRLDPETGEIVKTDGRCKRLSPTYDGPEEKGVKPKLTLKMVKEENAKLKEQIEVLNAKIQELTALVWKN